MNSEQIVLPDVSKDVNDKNYNQTFFPNTNLSPKIFKSPEKDAVPNINNLTNQINTKSNQDKTFYQKNVSLTEENNNNSKEHPLVFYALGKINNLKKNDISIPLYTSQGFRSTSNDLLKRNMHSINTSYYDELKKKKEYGTIKKQITEENDYLNPIKVFKTFRKYDINESCINSETYNIAKKKMYSRDRYSNIKKGQYITKKQFLEEKERLLNKRISKSIDFKEVPDNKLKYSFENTRYNYNNNDNNNDKLYKTINTEINTNKSIFKDPKDYTIEQLKSQDWRFDRNFKQFLKHKNWWKSDKYVILYINLFFKTI